MNLGLYLSVFIPLFGGLSLLAFKYYKTFNFYSKHIYFVLYSTSLFILGWNSSLFFSGSKDLLVDWWFLLFITVLLIYTKVIHKISKTEYYQDHGPEW